MFISMLMFKTQHQHLSKQLYHTLRFFQLHHSEKCLVYNFVWIFLEILLIYQIFHIAPCVPKFLNSRSFNDFHILLIYQYSQIPTTYQYFCLIPAVYQLEKNPFVSCLMGIFIFLHLLVMFLGYFK